MTIRFAEQIIIHFNGLFRVLDADTSFQQLIHSLRGQKSSQRTRSSISFQLCSFLEISRVTFVTYLGQLKFQKVKSTLE